MILSGYIYRIHISSLRYLAAILALFCCNVLLTPLLCHAADVDRDNNVKIIFGMIEDYPPHEFIQDGKPSGFDVEAVEEAARNAGIDVTWKPMPQKQIFDAFSKKEIDAACMAHTPEWEERFLFTDEPLIDLKLSLVVRKGTAGVNSLGDLSWRTVAVEEGDVTENEIRNHQQEAIIVLVPSQRDALEMVENGDVFSAYVNQSTAQYLINGNGSRNLEIAGESTFIAPRGIAFRPGENNLRRRMDAALAELKKTPGYNRLVNKWYGRTLIPPFPWKPLIIIVGGIVGALIIIILAVYSWNRSLRRSVQKRTAELEASEEFLSRVFNSIQDGISVLDKDLNIIRASDMMHKWYAHREPIEEKKCYESYHGRDEICPWCPSVKTLQSGEANYEMVPYVDDEGREGYMDLFTSPLCDREGRVIGVIEYVRNATERENNRKRIEQAKREWENIFESISDPTILLALDRTILDVNKASLDALGGKSREEIVGKKCSVVFHKEGTPPDQCPFDKLTVSNRAGAAEMWIDAFNGWFIVTAAPVYDENGEISKVIHIAKDVTERRKLEEQLTQAQKMEAVARMAGGVAHDFNNILTAVNGYCDLLATQLDEDDSRIKRVQQIYHATERAGEMVKQLLSFGKRRAVTPHKVDIAGIVRGLEGIIKQLAGAHIDVEIEACDDLWPILADPSQIEQVVMNLAVNARDAMPSGGRLTIELSNESITPDYCEKHFDMDPGEYVLLNMTDSGLGMDEETRKRAFDPFFTTKEPGKGTGLGLSTVYGIVRQFGGHIWLYSEPGYGTSVKIYFARDYGDKTPFPLDPKRFEDMPGGSETILAVEDDPQVLSYMEEILRGLGYKVIVASNGMEAIEEVFRYEGKIDLVISDYILPKMNGPEVVSRIRESCRDCKVLLISGYSALANGNGLPAESFPMLGKPFRSSDLAHKVREVLDGDS